MNPWRLAITLTAVLVVGCIPGLRPTRTPMPTLSLAGSADSACAVVLLPGMLDRAQRFERWSFGKEIERRGLSINVVAADAHFGYYRKRTIVDRLSADVVDPLATSHQRLWLVGISLGGVGAQLYPRLANDGPTLEGILLLAPFLGDEPVIDEIRDAGGLKSWQPAPPFDEGDVARPNWQWLQRHLPTGESPAIYLGYGLDDDFAGAGEVLSAELLDGRVFTRTGGHDWPTWSQLWVDFLASGALDHCRE